MDKLITTKTEIKNTPRKTGRITLKKRCIAKIFPGVMGDLQTLLEVNATLKDVIPASTHEIKAKGVHDQTSKLENELPEDSHCSEQSRNCVSVNLKSKQKLAEEAFDTSLSDGGKSETVCGAKGTNRTLVKKSISYFTINEYEKVECQASEISTKKVTKKNSKCATSSGLKIKKGSNESKIKFDTTAKVLIKKNTTDSILGIATRKKHILASKQETKGAQTQNTNFEASIPNKEEKCNGNLNNCANEPNILDVCGNRGSNLDATKENLINEHLMATELYNSKPDDSKLQSSDFKKKSKMRTKQKNLQKIKSQKELEISSQSNHKKDENTKTDNDCNNVGTTGDCNFARKRSIIVTRRQLKLSDTEKTDTNSSREKVHEQRVVGKKTCSNVITKSENKLGEDMNRPQCSLPNKGHQKIGKKVVDKRAQPRVTSGDDDQLGADMQTFKIKNKVKKGQIIKRDESVRGKSHIGGPKELHQNQGTSQSTLCSQKNSNHSNPRPEIAQISGERWTRSMTLRKGNQKRRTTAGQNQASPPKNPKLNGEAIKAEPLETAQQQAVPEQKVVRGRKKGKPPKSSVKADVGSPLAAERSLKFVGAHCSIAGGVSNAVTEAVTMGAKAFGLFVRNGRTWKLNPLNEAEAEKFKAACKEHGYSPNFILPHGSYLLNCGSSNPDVLQKSRDTLIHELKLCESLGLVLYNFHPGSACGDNSVDKCIKTIAESINMAHKETKNIKTVIENMSCQGNTVGGKLEELRAIIDRVEDKSRIGVCLDTCHAFAAGFDISTDVGYQKLMDEFDSVIGLQYLSGVHLNDSKGEVGCHLDRHENIGKGKIGLSGFRRIMNDSRLANIPMILETPVNDYAAEIRTLYSLEAKQTK